MPKEKRIFFDVPKMYKRQCLDHLMFGYVHGIRRGLPSVSIVDAIEMFKEDNSLTEEDYPMESAYKTYDRMRKEYLT